MPPGTVVIPTACVAISRNVDFDFVNPESCEEPAYRISKPVSKELHSLFLFWCAQTVFKVSADATLTEEVKEATLRNYISTLS